MTPPPARSPRPSSGRDLFTWLVMISVALLPWQLPSDGVATRISPADGVIALALLFGVTRIRVRRGSMLTAAAVFPIVALIGLLVGLVTAESVPPNAWVRVIGAFLLLGSLLCWQAAARQLHDGLVRLIRIFVVSGLVIGIVALIEWQVTETAIFTQQIVGERFAGGLADPNHYGALAALSLVLSIALRDRLFRARGIGVLVIAAHGIFLALTVSRGAWIACAAALLVLAVRSPSVRFRPSHLAAAAVLGFALVSAGIISSALDDFQSRPDNVGERGDLIVQALDDFGESNLLGIGLMVGFEKNGQIVHNSFLWALSDLGLVGALWFLGLQCEVFVRLRNLRLRAGVADQVLVAALLGGQVVMLVASVGVEAIFQRHWWFVFALIVALSAKTRPSEPLAGSTREKQSQPHLIG